MGTRAFYRGEDENWTRAREETGITIRSSIQIFSQNQRTAACTRFQPKSLKIRMTRSRWAAVAEKDVGAAAC
ncbi:hypothetical protein H5410_019847 [Solanum commersonii]|uniref:Uncharacterized protein n=1 Tax=Solanum commersonii TaxID=4109 RepID=A0A9J5ZCF5_SOLCO|nr:hypothetical protein H5410_019847 [Solanum commersonii]